MIESRIVNNKVCAVHFLSFNPNEIFLRFRGKQFYGTEESVVRIEEDKIVISKNVADKYGLSIEIE